MDPKDIEILDLTKELRKRWERIEGLSTEVATVYHELNLLQEENKILKDKLEVIFNASGLVRELKEELDHLYKQIKDVVDLVGDRYEEQGRVMMAFKVLEGIIEEEEDE